MFLARPVFSNIHKVQLREFSCCWWVACLTFSRKWINKYIFTDNKLLFSILHVLRLFGAPEAWIYSPRVTILIFAHVSWFMLLALCFRGFTIRKCKQLWAIIYFIGSLTSDPPIFRSDRISRLYIVSNVSVCYQFVNSRLKDWKTERIHWKTERLQDWKTERLKEWKTERLKDWKTERLKDWKTERLKDWKIERLKDWKTKRLNTPDIL